MIASAHGSGTAASPAGVTGSSPGVGGRPTAARPHALRTSRHGRGSCSRVTREHLDTAEVRLLERLVVAHRRRRRPQQEPHVAPVDRNVLELQDRTVGEQAVQVVGVERIDGSGTRDCTRRCSCSSSICRSTAGREVGLLVLQPPQLDDFAGFGAGGGFSWGACTAPDSSEPCDPTIRTSRTSDGMDRPAVRVSTKPL